jgi:hypothetical protein
MQNRSKIKPVRHFLRHFLLMRFARSILGRKKRADKKLKLFARRFLLNAAIWVLPEKVADKDATAQSYATLLKTTCFSTVFRT